MVAKGTSAIFIDRDGTMNEDVGYVSSTADFALYPWTAEAIRLINRAGLKAIVITNQSGIARGFLDEKELATIHRSMIESLASAGARIDGIYYCPHHPRIGTIYRQDCNCRKPRTGMLEQASREHQIDLSRSFVIGDKSSDIELAGRVGARSVLVLTGYGNETLEHQDKRPCKPDLVAENLLDAVNQILDTQQI